MTAAHKMMLARLARANAARAADQGASVLELVTLFNVFHQVGELTRAPAATTMASAKGRDDAGSERRQDAPSERTGEEAAAPPSVAVVVEEEHAAASGAGDDDIAAELEAGWPMRVVAAYLLASLATLWRVIAQMLRLHAIYARVSRASLMVLAALQRLTLRFRRATRGDMGDALSMQDEELADVLRRAVAFENARVAHTQTRATLDHAAREIESAAVGDSASATARRLHATLLAIVREPMPTSRCDRAADAASAWV